MTFKQHWKLIDSKKTPLLWSNLQKVSYMCKNGPLDGNLKIEVFITELNTQKHILNFS